LNAHVVLELCCFEIILYEHPTEVPMLNIEDYNDMIPVESNILYDTILKHLTNSFTYNALLILR